MTIKERIYEAPIARDLSSFSADGQDKPLGYCVSGPLPYEECVTGNSPHGTNPACGPGSLADYPKCETGSSAAVVCIVGGDAG